MDRRVVPFKRWHYEWLAAVPSAEHGSFLPSAEVLSQLEKQNSWTGVVDGDPIVCAGTLQHWPGRHLAWAYIRSGLLKHMPWITDEVLKNLATVKGRVELPVRADFPAGQRWARRLGFEVEAPLMRAYGPDGADYIGYVRMN